MKNASPIGIPNAAHCSSVIRSSSSQTRRLPTGRNSASPERSDQQVRARAHDPALVEVDQVLVLAGDRVPAQLAGLLARAERAPAPAPARAAGAAPPAIGSRIAPGGAAWVGSSSTPSTSRPSRSGAIASSAWRIPSSSVDADAAQPTQWPSSRIRATPSAIPSSSTFAAVGLHVGPHAVERLAHPVLERHGIEPVHQQQARDHAVFREPRAGLVVDRRP